MRPASACLLAGIALAPACGHSDAQAHEAYVWEQSCAPCHAIAPGRASPDTSAPNLSTVHPSREQVRRAIIDGRPGMPRGLVGGDDVDAVADYVVRRTAR
ncbi:MAG TPA: cytochrome c [Gaiellales bacterium]|nr:cytochrome c [Gaiellales bacterium]